MKEVFIMAKCLTHDCNNDGFIAIPMPDSGMRNRYLCADCARRQRSYYTENSFRMGERKAHKETESVELEVSFSDTQARAELLHFGFIPTHDGTVACEYKSPIYEGMCALSKQCKTIEKLMTDGHIRIGRECGTHFHIGHAEYINPVTMRYLRRFNGSLFTELSNAIMADPEKSARFFGRRPNTWAEPVTMYDPSGDYDGDRMKHSAMFNLQHDYTIEFRQAKFVNAKQYMQVAKFASDCMNAIIENFIKHFNDTQWDTARYPKRTDYRKHKAQVASNKMVKLYEKYTANI
jgi:hypothetical protein